MWRNFKSGTKSWLIVASLLLVFFVQASTSIRYKSATWDETHYFGLGKYLLKNLKWDVPGSVLHPPFSFYLHSLPLLFFKTDEAFWKYGPKIKRDTEFLANADIFRGQALLSSPLNQNDKLLNLSRLMMILLSLVLGYFVYKWSFCLYGRKSAFLALLWFIFSPNILAHARLITPDIAVTAFSFITIFYFWQSQYLNQVKYALLSGLFLGLALLSKFTALLLFPVIFMLWFVLGFKENNFKFKYTLVLLSLGTFILCLGYGFNLKPYFQGISFQLAHAKEGHSAFLNGRYSVKGWWYYFFVAFGLKTPLPTLILLFLSMFLFWKNPKNTKRRNELFVLIPPVFIFIFMSVKHQSIGLRYILPIYPFLFVFLSRIGLFIEKKFFKLGLGALLLWYAASSLFIYPHYLAYFNGLAGGPDNGYKYLVDSNLDWGQDLKGLKEYMSKEGINDIHLSYFGSDLPERYGIRYKWLPSLYLKNLTPAKKVYFPLKGMIAISVTNLQGVYFQEKNFYKWLKDYRPTAKIGYSIFIFNIK